MTNRLSMAETSTADRSSSRATAPTSDSRADPWSRILVISRKAQFSVDEVLPPGTRFDFRKPFLPTALTGVESLPWLDEKLRLTLGHVRAHTYLSLFGLVEEFILPFVAQHAQGAASGHERTQALFGFAAEEAKHIQLFERFRATFTAGAGRELGVIGPARAIAIAVLARPALSVALLVLHIEWLTQRHWIESVRGEGGLEPTFAELLRVHWMEEAQHARMDDLLVRELAAGASAAELEEGVGGYFDLLTTLGGALQDQARLDVESFGELSGRALASGERDELTRAQLTVLRRSFLLDGMTHPAFTRTFGAIAPTFSERLTDAAHRLA